MPTAVKERPAEPAAKARTPKPPPTITFEIERNDWIEILADAAVCSGDDNILPMLVGVRVRVSADGTITAYATDRFVMARRTYHLPAAVGADVDVFIPLDEVTAMGRIHAKPARRGVLCPIQVEITGETDDLPGGVVVRSGGTAGRRVESTHPGGKHQAIPYDTLLNAAPSEMSSLRLNPAQLAKFSRVSRRGGESMEVLLAGPNKAVLVRIGSHFTGAIMPIRAPRDGDR